jgi:hypothetical protein
MMLVVASTALIIASFVSPITRYCLACGPDVMLNASSLVTRDNPLVALPSKGTFMGATERARLVKDYRVRFGDVSADGDVGRLAIATLSSSGVPSVEPVQRKRLYI